MTMERKIQVNLASQILELWEGDRLLSRYSVSTAVNGAGELNGSGCTPRGRHKIRIKIGEAAPMNAVFVGRRPTGEIYSEALAEQNPGKDWILTRILWLTGCDPGRNRFGSQDTLKRFIYIHGCPDNEPMGIPRSHGCIRMRNRDLVELFDLVEPGTEVEIIESDNGVYCT
ncbi:MAG: hypothetical protein C0631_14585 [Sedimenticola sp.]|nr:MAG: hypothetical protein C0631_14585 [Sedimenticola sp.]